MSAVLCCDGYNILIEATCGRPRAGVCRTKTSVSKGVFGENAIGQASTRQKVWDGVSFSHNGVWGAYPRNFDSLGALVQSGTLSACSELVHMTVIAKLVTLSEPLGQFCKVCILAFLLIKSQNYANCERLHAPVERNPGHDWSVFLLGLAKSRAMGKQRTFYLGRVWTV